MLFRPSDCLEERGRERERERERVPWAEGRSVDGWMDEGIPTSFFLFCACVLVFDCGASESRTRLQTDGRDKPTKEVKISKSGELTE